MNIAKIHNSIICDKRLPDGAFMLYCFMAMEAGLNNGSEGLLACTALDWDVRNNASLSDNAFRLYSFMAMYAGNKSNQIRLKISELPELTNKTRKTVQRALTELISKGVIEQKEEDIFIIRDCIRDRKER